MDEIKTAAYKYAVKNAFEHDGEAQLNAVVGKVKAIFPDTDLGKAMPLIKETVEEVNSLSKEILEQKFKEFDSRGWELKHTEKEKTLPKLDWLGKKKLVTRVAPNPSGAMHFGHARPAILTDEYVKKYEGKYILRFDDTDPKIKVPIEGIEKEFLEEFKWLGIKVHEVFSASDNLKKYYKVIEKLLKKGHAYICFCETEKWRKLIWKSKECPCRKKTPKKQLKEWEKMLKHEIKEGEAVARIKTDLKNKDPSIRDWWLAKVVDKPEHPNKKTVGLHAWPAYNLASAVDDHETKINFIIRGQEHSQNETKQKFLYDYLGWEYPHTAYHGKLAKVGDMFLSKSKINELKESGEIKSDDDPRLATIKSLKRRGFQPGAIRKIILDMGMNPNDANVSMENLAAANKAVVGEVSDFPFFEDGAPVEVVNVSPGEGDAYGETVKFNGPIEKLIVDKKEIVKHKAGGIVRFKKGFNAKLEEVSEFGARANFVSYTKAKHPIISWILTPVDVNVLMSDGTKKVGLSAASLLEANGMVRFEGLGYAVIEEKAEGIIKCVFSYK